MVHPDGEEKGPRRDAASAGHGVWPSRQAAASAARRDLHATSVKVEAVKRFALKYVEVVRALIHRVSGLRGAPAAQAEPCFVHPFNDPDVIAGRGAIAMEITHQYQPSDGDQIDAVFCAIGGGGLISGIAAYIRIALPIQVIRCADRDSCAMKKSIDAGHPVDLSQVGLFSRMVPR